MKTSEPPQPQWRKSTHSNDCDCVEISAVGGQIGVRDSKNLAAGHLTLTRQAFTTLLTHLASQP